MYCGQESPSPSRPDPASAGVIHAVAKVTFILQICSCHAPVSDPSTASSSFRPKTNILTYLQGLGAWSQPTSAVLSHTFVLCCLPLKTLAASQVLAYSCHGYGFLCLEGSSSTNFMELATTNTLDLNPNVSSSGNSSLSPWSRSY